MPYAKQGPEFQVIICKADLPLRLNKGIKAMLWEMATMLEDGTINLQFTRYYPPGEILQGFDVRRPGSSGYQDILDRHLALKPKETSFLAQKL
jgi:hypothetical protein